ncbi:MAG: AMIN domain-containing protein [Myxococcota bacterium]|nr:AMIN domain-containing protein [Myxococcota bacterium]
MTVDTDTINFDTSLSPEMFTDSEDRRKSPRIPFEHTVRVGPAYGAPYATVKAENLSSKGIFVRSDKRAEPGAKFSLELSLPNYGRLYIPEAEVLYNRSTGRGTAVGFGATFTGLTDEVDEIIRSSATFASEITEPRGKDVSASMICDTQSLFPDFSTKPNRSLEYSVINGKRQVREAYEVPALTASELSVSLPPEPELDAYVSEVRDQRRESTDVVRIRKTPLRKKNRGYAPKRPDVRQIADRWGFDLEGLLAAGPSKNKALVSGLVIGGLVAFVFALSISLNSSKPKRELSAVELAKQAQIPQDTHQNLMAKEAAVIGITKKVSKKAPKKEESAKQVSKKPLVRSAVALPPVNAPKPAPVEMRKLKQTTLTTPKAVPAKPLKQITKQLASALPKAASNQVELAFGLTKDATVLRSYRLSKPERFVIDVAGQDGPIKLPKSKGFVTNIRVGEHTGYTRIVVDSEKKISSNEIRKQGKGITLNLKG